MTICIILPAADEKTVKFFVFRCSKITKPNIYPVSLFAFTRSATLALALLHSESSCPLFHATFETFHFPCIHRFLTPNISYRKIKDTLYPSEACIKVCILPNRCLSPIRFCVVKRFVYSPYVKIRQQLSLYFSACGCVHT